MVRYPQIAVLGGTGGVGSVVCRTIAEQTDAHVIVVGRHAERARQLAVALGGRGEALVLDVADKAALGRALDRVPLWIDTTSAIDHHHGIAETAIAAGVDLMDTSVKRRLADLAPTAERAGVRIVDQCGFHPGLCAPLAHWAARTFDTVRRCDIYLAMMPAFRAPASTYELVELVLEPGRVLVNGHWTSTTWKDARPWSFGSGFGQRGCMALDMVELVDTFAQLGVTDGGCWAGGFGGWIDNVLFPAIWLAYQIRPGLFRETFARALHRAGARVAGGRSHVEMVADVAGTRDGAPHHEHVVLTCDDGFLLTAVPIVAAVRHLDEHPAAPGLIAMGNLGDGALRAGWVDGLRAHGAHVARVAVPD